MVDHDIPPMRAPREVSALGTSGPSELDFELVVEVPVLVEMELAGEVTIEEVVLESSVTITSIVVVLVTGSMPKFVVLGSVIVVPPLLLPS